MMRIVQERINVKFAVMPVTKDGIHILMGRNLARLRKAKGLTQEKLAELAEVKAGAPYISSIERGERGLGKVLMAKICNALDVNAAEFTRQSNDTHSIPPPAGEIAVIFMCKGGASGFYEVPYATGGGFRYIKRPYDVTDPGAYAVEIRGDSMTPRYEEGEMVVASPEKEVHSGDYVVAQMASGEMAIKRIKFHNGMIVLSSVNPTVEAWICNPEEIIAFHKVVWKKEKS